MRRRDFDRVRLTRRAARAARAADFHHIDYSVNFGANFEVRYRF